MTIHQHPQERLRTRAAPLDMTGDQFRSLGHDLVDRIAASGFHTDASGHAGGIPGGGTRGLIREACVTGGGAGSRVPAAGRRRAAI